MSATLAVVVPHFRQTRYLAECLCSLIEQTRAPDEIIVVDSSAHETADVVRPFRFRIRHIPAAARGVAAARNAGIAAAASTLVAFLDADNLAAPGMCEAQVRAFEGDDPPVLCHGAVVPIDAEGRTYPESPVVRSEGTAERRQLGWLLERNRIATDTVCVPRDLLTAAGGFCEEPGVREDYDLWLRLAPLGRFEYLDRPLALYRRHDSNLSNDRRYMFEWEAGALRRVDVGTACDAIEAAFDDECERALVWAEFLLRRGDDAGADAAFRDAAARWPRETAFAFHLANLAYDAGRLDEAERLCRQMAAAEPGEAAVWNNLGVVAAASGRGEAAQQAFRRACELRPGYEDAAANLLLHAASGDDGGYRLTRRRLREVLLPLSATSAAAGA